MKRNKVKTLQNRCLKLWKEIIFKRDGKRCMVKYSYPDVPLVHTDIIQADHNFSRTCKHLIYEVNNGTAVCSGCNFKHNKKARLLIQNIVRQREGHERYEEMEQIYLKLAPNTNFNQVWWLEEKIKKLEELRRIPCFGLGL